MNLGGTVRQDTHLCSGAQVEWYNNETLGCDPQHGKHRMDHSLVVQVRYNIGDLFGCKPSEVGHPVPRPSPNHKHVPFGGLRRVVEETDVQRH